MDGQIAGEPFRPCAFPLGQQRESPLYRPEYRQHTEQDLLAIYRSPLANTNKIRENKHNENHLYFLLLSI